MDIIPEYFKLLKMVINNLPIWVHVGMFNVIYKKGTLNWYKMLFIMIKT